MKRDIEVEKYRFIGDSSVNRVLCTNADGSKAQYTQTDFIAALAQNKKNIKGGRKLKFGANNGKVSYLIDYGNDEKRPQQMIKVTIDEENIAKGDVNALAIDSICQHSIKIGKNNIKKKILSGVAMTLVTVSFAGILVGGFAYASKKEDEYQKQRMEEYITQMNEARRENGLDPLDYDGYSDSNYEETDVNEDEITSGKSK